MPYRGNEPRRQADLDPKKRKSSRQHEHSPREGHRRHQLVPRSHTQAVPLTNDGDPGHQRNVIRRQRAKFGVGDRYSYLEGDLRQVDFGGGYDLITLGHIIHGEGRDGGRRLVERSAEALADRGLLLIAEFIPNNDRTGPAGAMMFGINMLLHTPDGDVFTMKEYREWLKAAGFKTIRTISTQTAPSPLILAEK